MLVRVFFCGVLKESPTVVRTTRCDSRLRPKDMVCVVSPGFAPGVFGSRGNREEGWEGPAYVPAASKKCELEEYPSL